MIGMALARKRSGDLSKFADADALKMAARITNLWAASLADYIRANELSGQILDVQTGETRGSMGFYRYKGKKASFAVRPGKGVAGHLNYLAGMQKGMLAGRGRKVIIRPKPFMRPGYRTWKASGAPTSIKKAVYAAYLDKAFPKGASV
jgi:hypothetical protein